MFARNEKEETLKSYNTDFLNTSLDEIYEDISLESIKIPKKTLQESGVFNFPKIDTYHGVMLKYEGSIDKIAENEKLIYTKFLANSYHRISKD